MCSQVHKREAGRGGAEREGKMGDKPNYLLRIQRKCVINCGDPEESWRVEACGAESRGGQVCAAVYHLYPGLDSRNPISSFPKFALNRYQTG